MLPVSSEPEGAPATARWARGPLRPFRHHQYRWLASATFFELAGDGVWVIALVWQVIALGGGPSHLSFAVTGLALGMVGTALIGGVVADRVPQRRILVATAFTRTLIVTAIATLALTGLLTLWHLALASLLVGMTIGIYFPAYSALLPAIVDEEDLLAANGFEGFLRPTVQHAGGPAVGSVVVSAWSPSWAFVLVVGLQLCCLLSVLALRPRPLRRDPDSLGDGSFAGVFADLRGGVQYMVSTPWFLATLLFACVMILMVIGPIEVLIPFVVERGGGDPRGHALILAAYGIGGAAASLGISTMRMPKRYLTAMNTMWGVACLPLLVVGFTSSVPLIAVAFFVVGMLMSAPMVLWGTLLQRRVPPELLGRASSLDFFVSLLFMPVSMALAGPASEVVGLRTVFVVAAVVPVVVAMVAIVWARMPADEIAHPLDQDRTGEADHVAE